MWLLIAHRRMCRASSREQCCGSSLPFVGCAERAAEGKVVGPHCSSSGAQSKQQRAAVLQRCLGDEVEVTPGQFFGDVFRQWAYSLNAVDTRNLTLTKRQFWRRCLDSALPEAPGGRRGDVFETSASYDLTLVKSQAFNGTIEDDGVIRLRRCLGGVVTVQPGGRFGNAFMEWASAWAVARTYNLTLATPTELQDTLHEAFSSLPTGPTLAALLRSCPYGDGLEEDDAFRIVVRREYIKTAAAFAAAVARASSAVTVPGPLAYQACVVLSPYIARVAEELRAQVQWKRSLSVHAQTTLHEFGALTAAKYGDPIDKVVFVGMHVRRTDYPKFIRWRLNLPLNADSAYYLRAVRFLSRVLEAEAEAEFSGENDGVAGPLAVVVASDDMPWVQEVLLPALKNYTRSAVLRLTYFAGGSGTSESTLQDLALLSACNHSIISYGTFGMTAALLSGGRVVAFRLDSSYPTSEFAKLLPGWKLLR